MKLVVLAVVAALVMVSAVPGKKGKGKTKVKPGKRKNDINAVTVVGANGGGGKEIRTARSQ